MHVVTAFWATLADLEFWRATAQNPRCPRLTGKDPQYAEFLEWADRYGALPGEARY